MGAHRGLRQAQKAHGAASRRGRAAPAVDGRPAARLGGKGGRNGPARPSNRRRRLSSRAQPKRLD